MFSRKDLQRLIIPLIVEQFLSITIGMADTVMVSVCGEAAVSGVSLVDAINILMINIFSALATGGAIVSSQYIGREDLGKACEAAKQLVLAVFVLSTAIGAIFVFGGPQVLGLLYHDIEADVMASAESYFFLTACPTPLSPCTMPARRCSARWQLQGFDDHLHRHELHQHRRQCAVHLRLRYGRGGRRRWPP